MCSRHISRLECRSFFLYFLPTSLWWSLSRVPAALFSTVRPRGSHLSQVPVMDKSLGGRPLRTWLFHGRTGGGGSLPVDLLPVTQRTFWLQSHCKAWEFPGGKERAGVLVLALQGLQQWRAYSDDLPSAYNPLATAQTSVLWNETQMVAGERPRLPELIMERWSSFAVRTAQRYLFWKHVAVLHHPASPPWPSCQKPLVTFGSSRSHVSNHLQ